MSKVAQIGDKVAVSISFLCAIHCFATPVFLALVPSLQIFNCSDVHFWTLVLIIPTSAISLGLGCKKHKNSNFFVIALIGLTILFVSSIWGHQLFGCKNEKYVTLIGSCIVSFAHVKNYFLCRKFNNNIYQSDKYSECCE